MLVYCKLDAYDKSQWNLNQNTTNSIDENSFVNVVYRMAAILR